MFPCSRLSTWPARSSSGKGTASGRNRALFWPLALVSAALMFPVFRMMGTRPSAFFVFPAGHERDRLPFVRRRRSRSSSSEPRAGEPALDGVLLVLLLAGPVFLYVRHFYLTPTYDLERASRFFETLPPGSVVMGQEAPRLTLGTPFKALLAYENWFNDRDTFNRFKPTHLVVLDRFGGAEEGWIRRRLPGNGGPLRARPEIQGLGHDHDPVPRPGVGDGRAPFGVGGRVPIIMHA